MRVSDFIVYQVETINLFMGSEIVRLWLSVEDPSLVTGAA